MFLQILSVFSDFWVFLAIFSYFWVVQILISKSLFQLKLIDSVLISMKIVPWINFSSFGLLVWSFHFSTTPFFVYRFHMESPILQMIQQWVFCLISNLTGVLKLFLDSYSSITLLIKSASIFYSIFQTCMSIISENGFVLYQRNVVEFKWWQIYPFNVNWINIDWTLEFPETSVVLFSPMVWTFGFQKFSK